MSEGHMADAARTEATRKASRDVLKAVYGVLFGLAIREALNRGFLDRQEFTGMASFDEQHLPALLMCVVFLTTAVRFVHGAFIHIEVLSSNPYKPLIDATGFLLQGTVLYLMAITVHSPLEFAMIFIILMTIDIIWLLAIHLFGYHKARRTEYQWIASNLVMILVSSRVIHSGGWVISYVVAMMLFSLAAAALDYVYNRSFYFPSYNTNAEYLEKENVQMTWKLVIIESPFRGAGTTAGDIQTDRESKIKYARRCMRDCLLRNEAPMVSHLLYTQEGVLSDDEPKERELRHA